MKILVSIIVPIYNSENYLDKCINSIINQSFNDWELILINDCSTDNSLNIANKYINHKNIFIIDIQENGGVANARNIGLSYARGSHVAFLDSDDYWLPTKLEKQLQFMTLHNAKISFTSYYKIDTNDKIISEIIKVPKFVNYINLLKQNVIPLSSSIIETDFVTNFVFKKIGHEDFAFWLHALKHTTYAIGLNEPLLHYRITKGSLSHNKFRSAYYTWSIFRNEERFNIFTSFFYFCNYVFYSSIKYFK
jgi:glycosyltransferase involved in cell wall biosynthesis